MKNQTNLSPDTKQEHEFGGSPKKLSDGTWGVIIPKGYDVRVGSLVRITARSGRSWRKRVSELVAMSRGLRTVRTSSEVLDPETDPSTWSRSSTSTSSSTRTQSMPRRRSSYGYGSYRSNGSNGYRSSGYGGYRSSAPQCSRGGTCEDAASMGRCIKCSQRIHTDSGSY